MSWQTVRLEEVSPTRWRNGGGSTRELAAWPGAADWIWRMSVAEVASNGPFSHFEAVQRWFTVLAGAGVRLTIGASVHELGGASVPLCFDGALAVDCELLDGPTQDFNLMLRRPQASARMRRISGVSTFVLDASRTVAVYAIDSGCKIIFEGDGLALAPHSLAWQDLKSGAVLEVQSDGALWMEIWR
jgi:environmental stress-induced protein Ves